MSIDLKAVQASLMDKADKCHDNHIFPIYFESEKMLEISRKDNGDELEVLQVQDVSGPAKKEIKITYIPNLCVSDNPLSHLKKYENPEEPYQKYINFVIDEIKLRRASAFETYIDSQAYTNNDLEKTIEEIMINK